MRVEWALRQLGSLILCSLAVMVHWSSVGFLDCIEVRWDDIGILCICKGRLGNLKACFNVERAVC